MNKIETLKGAMTTKIRKSDNDKEFYIFTDTAPEALVTVFLNNYDVRDINYQIFNTAINVILDETEEKIEGLEDYIMDNMIVDHYVSIYTSDRLEYLNSENDNEIADILKDHACESISEACATWYHREVENAISLIINKYLLK